MPARLPREHDPGGSDLPVATVALRHAGDGRSTPSAVQIQVEASRLSASGALDPTLEVLALALVAELEPVAAALVRPLAEPEPVRDPEGLAIPKASVRVVLVPGSAMQSGLVGSRRFWP